MPSSNFVFALIVIAFGIAVSPTLTVAQPVRQDETRPPVQDATTPPVPVRPVPERLATGPRNADLYQVPASDQADELVRYLRTVLDFDPKTLVEYRLHVERGPEAVQTVANRLIAMETDPARLAFRIGRLSSIHAKLIRTPFVDADVQAALVDEIQQVHATFADQPDVYEDVKRELFDAAKRTTRAIEQSGNTELAISANRSLGQLFVEDVDRRLATSGRRMIGEANRLASVGQSIDIEGQLIDGSTFDWSAYRGQVVLVFFMSTTVGPVDAELPQLKRLYREYAEDGFRIVLVGLDEKQTVLSEYIEKKAIVWPCLFADGAGWDNPLAIEFGVDQLPLGMLFDTEGKLVSDRARTTELQRLLQEAFGH